MAPCEDEQRIDVGVVGLAARRLLLSLAQPPLPLVAAAVPVPAVYIFQHLNLMQNLLLISHGR